MVLEIVCFQSPGCQNGLKQIFMTLYKPLVYLIHRSECVSYFLYKASCSVISVSLCSTSLVIPQWSKSSTDANERRTDHGAPSGGSNASSEKVARIPSLIKSLRSVMTINCPG